MPITRSATNASLKNRTQYREASAQRQGKSIKRKPDPATDSSASSPIATPSSQRPNTSGTPTNAAPSTLVKTLTVATVIPETTLENRDNDLDSKVASEAPIYQRPTVISETSLEPGCKSTYYLSKNIKLTNLEENSSNLNEDNSFKVIEEPPSSITTLKHLNNWAILNLETMSNNESLIGSLSSPSNQFVKSIPKGTLINSEPESGWYLFGFSEYLLGFKKTGMTVGDKDQYLIDFQKNIPEEYQEHLQGRSLKHGVKPFVVRHHKEGTNVESSTIYLGFSKIFPPIEEIVHPKDSLATLFLSHASALSETPESTATP